MRECGTDGVGWREKRFRSELPHPCPSSPPTLCAPRLCPLRGRPDLSGACGTLGLPLCILSRRVSLSRRRARPGQRRDGKLKYRLFCAFLCLFLALRSAETPPPPPPIPPSPAIPSVPFSALPVRASLFCVLSFISFALVVSSIYILSSSTLLVVRAFP